MPDKLDVLAIGIDAAEPTLMQSMIDSGELPAMQHLMGAAQWRRVSSPSDIGSGAVWPSFITGRGPARHGVYAEWAWRPRTMAVERYSGSDLMPFWKSWSDADVAVGMLDVPFAPLLGLRDGFEIKEWGPHDAFDGHCSAHPTEVAAFVNGFATHPFYQHPVDPSGPGDLEALRALAAACLRGARLRGELAVDLLRTRQPRAAIITFPEIHHASHYLWHGVAPNHDVYASRQIPSGNGAADALGQIFREVDRQVGSIVREAGDGTAVMVFSLHGMRPANGIAAFLGPLLCEAGFARICGWREQSWRERAASAFAAVKRSSPRALKKFYYRAMPPTTTRRLARSTMLPSYDWRRTRAIALPSDQHGWIRLNLAGRESAGIAPSDAYDRVCEELTVFVSSLTDIDGRPLASKTIRTSARVEDAMHSALPDLVVHWTDAALACPLHIKGFQTTGMPVGQKFTGQHALDGFCLWRGPQVATTDVVHATDLGGMLTAALRTS